jgi:UDP-glucose:(heptosyl)LPS alpha-1,3-glucosyltransferase
VPSIAMAMEKFSVHAGGAESYAVHLARRLVSAGWEVHFYGHSWDGDPPEARFHEIPGSPRWWPASLRILHFAMCHRKAVRNRSYDVILGFGNTLEMNVYQSHGGVHRRSASRKVLAVPSWYGRLMKRISIAFSPKHHVRAWIESAPFRAEKRPVLIAISEMVRRDMSDYFGVPLNAIHLLYNGIDVQRFAGKEHGHHDDLRRQLGFDQEVLFLFMSYDLRKKGARFLVEAAGKLRDRVGAGRFGVVFVGAAPYRSLRKLVDGLELDSVVKFRGPTREPEAVYQECDVFVLPTFYDACSLVVFEAMAAGLPAITGMFNGAAGIITPGMDGVVLRNPADAEEICDAMEIFLDPEVLAAASAAARRTAGRYTLETNHDRMIAILREAGQSGSR